MKVRSTLCAMALLAMTCSAAAAQTNPLVGAWSTNLRHQRTGRPAAAAVTSGIPDSQCGWVLLADGDPGGTGEGQ